MISWNPKLVLIWHLASSGLTYSIQWLVLLLLYTPAYLQSQVSNNSYCFLQITFFTYVAAMSIRWRLPPTFYPQNCWMCYWFLFSNIAARTEIENKDHHHHHHHHLANMELGHLMTISGLAF